MKRALDLGIAAGALLVLSPFMLAIAIIVRLDSGRPVFFCQPRVGKDFKTFTLYKFRTMTQPSGRFITVGDDHRVTRSGRVLRRLKLDELPQLYNVLKGDMSLVGPRPEIPEWVARFRSDFEIVLSVRPGLTDPASLKYRNEEWLLATSDDPETLYAEVILPDKIAISKRYVAMRTLRLDFDLMFRTVGTLARDRHHQPPA